MCKFSELTQAGQVTSSLARHERLSQESITLPGSQGLESPEGVQVSVVFAMKGGNDLKCHVLNICLEYCQVLGVFPCHLQAMLVCALLNSHLQTYEQNSPARATMHMTAFTNLILMSA